ncbi:DUF6950 family protein [Nitrobacter sp. TKz-YC01]|uniref:DUF6950 family protein n=1 Tax=Nitrobacter sp. TKz-YC01 TaxID=3398703 RepID=UPI003A0FD7A0
MTLTDYFASVLRRRWSPGTWDCSTFMADWVVNVCGRDPIADVRGTYSSEREFQRIVAREGGFIAACHSRLTAVGMRSTETPEAGDIVAVDAPYSVGGEIRRRPTGAICAAPRCHAVVTSDMGLVMDSDDRLPMLRAWTF